MSLTDNLESPVAHEVDLMAMLDPATTAEVSRIMQICNACRYCEGFCAVFPAMERRRLFAEGDVSYLANLCHNCLLYTSPSPRDRQKSRMPSSA